MSSASLHSARLKIIRAQDHLSIVKREIKSYIDTNPHALRTYKNVKGGWMKGAEIRDQPDDRMSLAIGDCVTNARSALDHVMFQLVLKWFDPPFDIRNRDHRLIAGFPLFERHESDPQSSESNRFAKLKAFMPKAPTDVFATIKSVQPYNRGYEPLWWLHELVNTDKHRLLLVTKSEINWSNYFVWDRYKGIGLTIPSSTGLSHGDILRLSGRYSTNAPTSELPAEMEVNYEPTIEITFKDVTVPPKGTPVDVALRQIIDTVHRVIPQFERFF